MQQDLRRHRVARAGRVCVAPTVSRGDVLWRSKKKSALPFRRAPLSRVRQVSLQQVLAAVCAAADGVGQLARIGRDSAESLISSSRSRETMEAGALSRVESLARASLARALCVIFYNARRLRPRRAEVFF